MACFDDAGRWAQTSSSLILKAAGMNTGRLLTKHRGP